MSTVVVVLLLILLLCEVSVSLGLIRHHHLSMSTSASAYPILWTERNREWTDSDQLLLADLTLTRPSLSWEEVAVRLNRSVGAVRQRVLSVERERQWNDEEMDRLSNLAVKHDEDWREVDEQMGVSAGECRRVYLSHLRSMQSDESETWSEEEDSLLLRLSPSGLEGKTEEVDWRAASHALRRSGVACRLRYLRLSLGGNTESERDVWFENESDSLQRLVTHFGFRWSLIGRVLGRTPQQCLSRYRSISASAGLGRGGGKSRTWGSEEDQLLLSLVQQMPGRWTDIGLRLERTASQARQRHQILNLSAKGGPKRWTEDQLQQLCELVDKFGAKWTEIGKKIDRTPHVCRSAYKRVLDKMSSQRNSTLPMPRSHPQSERAEGEDFGIQRVWSKREDEWLKRLVGSCGRKWTVIAEAMGRSPEDVMVRFDFKISGHRRAGVWSKSEDLMLKQLVTEIGPKWAKVGAAIGRSGAQCSLRYRLTLNPNLKWKLWSPAEDQQLVSFA